VAPPRSSSAAAGSAARGAQGWSTIATSRRRKLACCAAISVRKQRTGSRVASRTVRCSPGAGTPGARRDARRTRRGIWSASSVPGDRVSTDAGTAVERDRTIQSVAGLLRALNRSSRWPRIRAIDDVGDVPGGQSARDRIGPDFRGYAPHRASSAARSHGGGAGRPRARRARGPARRRRNAPWRLAAQQLGGHCYSGSSPTLEPVDGERASHAAKELRERDRDRAGLVDGRKGRRRPRGGPLGSIVRADAGTAILRGLGARTALALRVAISARVRDLRRGARSRRELASPKSSS